MTQEGLKEFIYKKIKYFVPEPALRTIIELLNQQKEYNATKHDNQRNPN